MKTYIILFFACISIQIFAQKQLTIVIEDFDSFKRIANTNVLIETKSGKSSLFQSDENGMISVPNVMEDVTISVLKKGYETLQADYDMSEDLTVKFILSKPNPEEMPEVNDFLLEKKVVDFYNGKTLANATIKFGQRELKSDNNGIIRIPNDFFKEDKLELNDSIEFQLSAPNYKTLTDYYHFVPAKLMGTFELNANTEEKISPSHEITDEKLIKEMKTEIENSLEVFLKANCPRLPRYTIKVGTNCYCNSCGYVTTMSIETYTQSGLDNEWIASWNAESLKAGSVAYRTYGAYYITHPYSSRYDLANTTCKQAWGSSVYTSTRNASIATTNQFLVKNGAIAFAEYSAENNALGYACGNGNIGGNGYPCVNDWVCTGRSRSGHGRGMCQWGSSRWATRGYTYAWILDHYYNPAGIYRCNGVYTPPNTRPDIVIQAMWTSPSSPCRGNSTRLYVTVKNVGNGASNAVDYRRTINGATAFTGTIPALAPGGSITYYRTYTFWNLGNNSYCVYVNGASGEQNTLNNSYCITKNVSNCKSDLAISNPKSSILQPTVDSPFDVSWNIDWQGDASKWKSDGIAMSFYLSKDNALSADDVLLESKVVQINETIEQEDVEVQTPEILNDVIVLPEEEMEKLGENFALQTIEVQSLTLPKNTKSGTYYILIQADSNHKVAEMDETNNIKSVKIELDNSIETIEPSMSKTQISPNPTTGALFFKTAQAYSVIKVEVLDLNGNSVKIEEGRSLESIDISSFKPGIYLLKVLNNQNETEIFRITKK